MKSRELKYFIAVLMFLLACYLFSGRWAGDSFSPGTRNPASIQKVFDYSYLGGDSLLQAAKERLGNSVQISLSSDKTEAIIELGNFVLMDDKNQKDFACGFYDKVALSFEAQGVAVDGQKPQLVVEAKCEVAENINALVPIHVPLSKIKTEKPSDTEFKFYQSKTPLTVRLQNAPGTWPKHWVLNGIKLTHSQFTSRILSVDTFKQNISMNW
jgi:hypothetical protein